MDLTLPVLGPHSLNWIKMDLFVNSYKYSQKNKKYPTPVPESVHIRRLTNLTLCYLTINHIICMDYFTFIYGIYVLLFFFFTLTTFSIRPYPEELPSKTHPHFVLLALMKEYDRYRK